MSTKTLPNFYASTKATIRSLEDVLAAQTGQTTHYLKFLKSHEAMLASTKANLKQARADKDADKIAALLVTRTQREDAVKAMKAEISGSKYLSMLTVEQITKLDEFIDYTDGTDREYKGDKLGTALKVGSFAEDSPEWHEARANGIGGSDIAIIMGISPFKTRDALIKLKTGEIVQKANNSGGAALRGHIWENYIAREFAANNTDKKVMFTKDSWHKTGDDFHKANFDGLICENGSLIPNAILEIKTASNPESWENGVPEHYRLQVLWYMDACGFDKGYVAVMINDTDYREFEVVARDGEMELIHEAVSVFLQDVATRKEQLALAA